MAAPHVAGVAALILSQRGRMSPGAVKAALTGTAVPIECPPSHLCQGGWSHYRRRASGSGL